MASDFQRLNDFVESRRLDLRLKLGHVAERGGIHRNTLRAILRGEREPDRLTLRGIDAGLDWEPGSAERILDGGEPRDRQASPLDALREIASGVTDKAARERLLARLDELEPRVAEVMEEVQRAQQQRGA